MNKITIGIDINGLNPEDRARIAVVGLWKWMDEVAAAKFRKSAMPSYKRCALGSKCFHAKRRHGAYVTEGNGKYCSAECRESARAGKLRERAAYRRNANSDPLFIRA